MRCNPKPDPKPDPNRGDRCHGMRCAALKCHKYVARYGRVPGTMCPHRVASQRSSDTGPSQSNKWNTPVTKGKPDSITKIGPRFLVENARVSMVFFKPDGKSKMSAVHSGLMMRAFMPLLHTQRDSKRERESGLWIFPLGFFPPHLLMHLCMIFPRWQLQ